MKLYIAAALITLAADEAMAFTSPVTRVSFHRVQQMPVSQLYTQHTPEEQQVADDEIKRLQSMAQRLRAEATLLETERAQELAEAAERAFCKFNTNKDGEISPEELKAGLERELKTELPDERVKRVMKDFDISGDGKLRLEEFVTVEKFRNKLEALAREEKQQALDAAKAAQTEEEMAKLAEARLNLLNDREPTTRDKIVSVLPYLLPLLDNLEFGRFLVVENADNPFFIILSLIYGLYRSVPFGGFIAYIALNTLSSNPNVNRLVRFNMQQAINVDIALFFPSLIGAAAALISSGAGFQIPPGVAELGSDAIFVAVLLTLGYASASSLLGITPDKIPFISQAVEDRMLSVDMFDESGRFIPREMREKREDVDKKD